MAYLEKNVQCAAAGKSQSLSHVHFLLGEKQEEQEK